MATAKEIVFQVAQDKKKKTSYPGQLFPFQKKTLPEKRLADGKAHINEAFVPLTGLNSILFSAHFPR